MTLIKSFFKKYKTIKIIIMILTIILLGFIFMQVNTNSVIEDVYDAFYSTDQYLPQSYKDNFPDSYADKPDIIFIDDDEFNNNINSHFNWLSEYNNNDDYTIELEVERVYTIHNFKSGYIWIKYSVSVLDKKGDTVTGSYDIPVKMKIKKDKSNWEITKINEKEGYANRKDFWNFWTL